MRTPLLVAAVLWTTVSFAQTKIQNAPPQVQAQQVQAQAQVQPTKLQFVPPAELAIKPGRPQASAANAYTVSMTVQGVNGMKQPWTVTVPLRSYVAHAIVSPRDPASGLPTGKRMHKPFSITMEKSVSTPLILHLQGNEPISSVTLNFSPVTPGAATHTFVIRDVQGPKVTAFEAYSEVAFTYQKISWTYVEGGKTAMDDWEAPVV